MPNAHALLGPSASKRWLACPPSARLNAKLNAKFGEHSSSYADEGTKAHSLSELKLRLATKEMNKFKFEEMKKTLGEIPNDMDIFTDRYVDTVLEKYYAARKRTPDAKLFIEQQVSMARWAPNCWGTSDAVVVSDDVLVVMDLKYGKGVPVSAEGNSQARLYALGGLAEFEDLYGFTEIHTIIIQPRLDSITEEVLTKDELIKWGESIHDLAVQADRGEGEFKTGDHCRFCAARAICAARAAEAMDIFKHGFDEPCVIEDRDIPAILDVLDETEKWIKDIRAYALNQALNGVEWRGYKLVHGKRPGRKWRSADEAMNILARAGYSEEQYMVHELMSPSELEKSLGKKEFEALMEKQVYQGEGPITLVPESDTRVEYTSAEASLADLTN